MAKFHLKKPVLKIGLMLMGVILNPQVSNASSAYVWDATSGLLPDQTAQPWSLVNTALPNVPVLANGVLTISTTAETQNMYFIQGSAVNTSSDFFIDAKVKFISGESSNASRAPIAILFSTGNGYGNSLYIGDNQAFINSANLTVGSVANVKTADAFHDYLIDVSAAGAISVYYDGSVSPVITGHTFYSLLANDTQQRIAWGEASALATGVSEWTSFSTNAISVPSAAIPVPAPIWLLLAALPGLFGFKRSGRKA